MTRNELRLRLSGLEEAYLEEEGVVFNKSTLVRVYSYLVKRIEVENRITICIANRDTIVVRGFDDSEYKLEMFRKEFRSE